MKVSDYIVEYLKSLGVSDVFGYPGGMITHLMDSFSNADSITSHLCYNEQGGGFAACAWAATTGKLGVMYATSGPGATNFITPLCHAYFESLPVLFISGQVNRNEGKQDTLVRQRGFQETNIVSAVKGFTKFSAYVEQTELICYYLEKAVYYAFDGRPGAVLLDIPMDILRGEIEPDELKHFPIPQKTKNNACDFILEKLKKARRPLVLAGNGINSSYLRREFEDFIKKTNLPFVTSMTAVDLSSNLENFYGFVGAYGNRYANFAVSKCDLLLTLGTRLDFRQTGIKRELFAQNAEILRVDVDTEEFSFNVNKDETQIPADLRDLLPELSQEAVKLNTPKWILLLDRLKEMLKEELQIPEIIMQKLSEISQDIRVITTDVGQNQVWASQFYKFSQEQRMLFSGGHGSMGFSLPAAIGAAIATKQPVLCINGDGGFQMNIQELQWIAREKLPIKIIILNNNSLGMMRHFQEMYFNSNFTLTVPGKGYENPDFAAIAAAYGISSRKIHYTDFIKSFEFGSSPELIEIIIDKPTYVIPKLEFGQPFYNQDPKLSSELINELLNLSEEDL